MAQQQQRVAAAQSAANVAQQAAAAQRVAALAAASSNSTTILHQSQQPNIGRPAPGQQQAGTAVVVGISQPGNTGSAPQVRFYRLTQG